MRADEDSWERRGTLYYARRRDGRQTGRRPARARMSGCYTARFPAFPSSAPMLQQIMSIRRIAAGALALLALVVSAEAPAQAAFPSHGARLVVPFPPGG